MTSDKYRFRFGIALLAGGLAAFPAASAAQSVTRIYESPTIVEDAGARLSRHLRTLAGSPRSLDALMGAGHAALELGDPQTALTFFARAEEVSPRAGRVKAGMGSALVLMEQAPAALKFFADASSMGAREVDFAGDRGLAYDLTGDPRRAQADYALVLKRGDVPEVRRRLALSLAISGDREGALAAIDAQVRKQDRAAWRVRAFVLALTGDAAGATAATEAVMPQQAAAMRPFFARLPALNPAQRAMAVHFGHFPGDGEAVQLARNDVQPAIEDRIQSLAGDAVRPAISGTNQTALARRNPQPEPVTAEPRRRPGASQIMRERYGSRAAGGRAGATRAVTPSKPETKAPAVAQSAGAATSAKAEPVPARSQPTVTAGVQPGFSTASVSQPLPLAESARTPAEPDDAADRGSGLVELAGLIGALPERAPPQQAAPIDAKPDPAARAEAKLPFGPPTAPVSNAEKAVPLKLAQAEKKVPFGPPSAPPPATDEKSELSDAKPARKKAEPAKSREASRIWVQIAGGANKDALPREFTRLKGKAPDLLNGRTAWTAPLNATNRLLVGPFKTEKEAQSFVNELAKTGLNGFSWTSPDGAEIAKLAS